MIGHLNFFRHPYLFFLLRLLLLLFFNNLHTHICVRELSLLYKVQLLISRLTSVFAVAMRYGRGLRSHLLGSTSQKSVCVSRPVAPASFLSLHSSRHLRSFRRSKKRALSEVYLTGREDRSIHRARSTPRDQPIANVMEKKKPPPVIAFRCGNH